MPRLTNSHFFPTYKLHNYYLNPSLLFTAYEYKKETALDAKSALSLPRGKQL
jgi:hypothetical protein